MSTNLTAHHMLYEPGHLFPASEWHEAMGDVLWWRFPVTEAPWVGSPISRGRTVVMQILGADDPMLQTSFRVGGYTGDHTHFQLIDIPEDPDA